MAPSLAQHEPGIAFNARRMQACLLLTYCTLITCLSHASHEELALSTAARNTWLRTQTSLSDSHTGIVCNMCISPYSFKCAPAFTALKGSMPLSATPCYSMPLAWPPQGSQTDKAPPVIKLDKHPANGRESGELNQSLAQPAATSSRAL